MICLVSRFVRPVGLHILKDEESFIWFAQKWAIHFLNTSNRELVSNFIYFLTVATIWGVMLTKRRWAPKKFLRISKWDVHY